MSVFCEPHERRSSPPSSAPTRNTCTSCGAEISDRYLLQVNNLYWHVKCLKCSVCRTPLRQHSSCYVKNAAVFCKTDYISTFGTKCSRCGHQIVAGDWVRRARTNTYHLSCFSCSSCQRQLSTGEQFGLLRDRVLCRTHYGAVLESLGRAAESGRQVAIEAVLPPENRPKAIKRARTSFTADQLQVMQTQFTRDNNPDGPTLQRLADLTGLSRRVIQVWFQNCRARHKKHPGLQYATLQSMTRSRLPVPGPDEQWLSPGRTHIGPLQGFTDNRPFPVLAQMNLTTYNWDLPSGRH